MGFSYEDERECRAVSAKWAKAYDTKDWELLKSICTTTMSLIYSAVAPMIGDKENVPIDAFVAVMSSPSQLGALSLKTQHHLGGVVFDTSLANGRVKAEWQVRAAHIRYFEGKDPKEWIGHAYCDHFYTRGTDGAWKLCGIRPHTILFEIGSHGDVMGTFE